jgi:hypothetical protein
LQIDDTTATTWIDLPGYQVIPDGSGGLKIKLTTYPYNLDGQVLWWSRNGHVPTTPTTVSSTLNAGETNLNVVGDIDIGESGWLKINAEWMSYAGVTRTGDAAFTITNLVRDLNGTVDAQHLVGTTVEWGIAADRGSLWRQLYDQISAYLHEYFLTDASARERDHHERQISFYQKRADVYWESYVPSFNPKLVWTFQSIGALD